MDYNELSYKELADQRDIQSGYISHMRCVLRESRNTYESAQTAKRNIEKALVELRKIDMAVTACFPDKVIAL